jgi:type IV pilus assembly protein PilM
MEFLPKALGTRPRLACEVRADGVVSARAEDAAGLLVAVSRADLADGVLAAGLKLGNILDRAAVVAAVRSTLDAVAGRGAERTRNVTLIVPDAAVRVLLLDFDALPGKTAEALSVVRFRLKKLLPFDADDAVVSYQIMSSARDQVRVVAVAMPREVLAEYEAVVTSAGYVAGAVLPSTLAALGALEESEAATLVVNAGAQQVTTAIVHGGVLLLHRSLDMTEGVGVELPVIMPIVDRESSAQEWAQQEAVSPEMARQAEVMDVVEIRESAESAAAREVTQAVSVAAAYFEDTLLASPEIALAAGTLGADTLERMLATSGLDGLRVKELMETRMIAAGAVTASIARGWLAGVRGALTS